MTIQKAFNTSGPDSGTPPTMRLAKAESGCHIPQSRYSAAALMNLYVVGDELSQLYLGHSTHQQATTTAGTT
jgi:hypothetical protein